MITQFKQLKASTIYIAAGLLGFASSLTYSCTTVFQNDNHKALVVARTMDLYIPDLALVLAEPRGITRTDKTGKNPLSWTAKYGSVVVTAFHTNTVSDGINEKGLAAHLLYLTDTEYPAGNNDKPTISNAMWAQYILDNYSTVEEALQGTKDMQIVSTEVHGKMWPIHLTMEDATGDSAVIEYIKGKMTVYHGSQYNVMTNEPAYNIQLANLKRYKEFGGKLTLPGDTDPLSRFVRASTFLKSLPKANNELESIAGVLSVIRTAMVPFGAVNTSESKIEDAWETRWVTVADLTNKAFYFNSTSAPNVLWIDLEKINFAKGAPVLSIDPTDIHLEGDISKKLMPQAKV